MNQNSSNKRAKQYTNFDLFLLKLIRWARDLLLTRHPFVAPMADDTGIDLDYLDDFVKDLKGKKI